MEMAPHRPTLVTVIEPRTRVFVGNLPKCKTTDNIQKSFHVMTSGLRSVMTFPNKPSGNRGFCFLNFTTHGAAVAAIERLNCIKFFGTQLSVEFATDQVKMKSVTNIKKAKLSSPV